MYFPKHPKIKLQILLYNYGDIFRQRHFRQAETKNDETQFLKQGRTFQAKKPNASQPSEAKFSLEKEKSFYFYF